VEGDLPVRMASLGTGETTDEGPCARKRARDAEKRRLSRERRARKGLKSPMTADDKELHLQIAIGTARQNIEDLENWSTFNEDMEEFLTAKKKKQYKRHSHKKKKALASQIGETPSMDAAPNNA
jgi:hypothetical protein